MINLSRRQFLAASAAVTACVRAPAVWAASGAASPSQLSIEKRSIEVAGKAASVFGLRQPNGQSGIIANAGDRLHLSLHNKSGEAALIHWHGQTPPMAQDGVPGLSAPALEDGQSASYDFALRPGTHWMHSHHGLQEQLLMAAPLVVREDAKADEQDVVVLLHDFSFTSPIDLLAALRNGADSSPMHGGSATAMPMNHMGGMMVDHSAHMSQMAKTMAASNGGAMPFGHANDIDYDAYLANDRTLDDPQLVKVERKGRIRLRLINGATATSFVIDTGALAAQVLSVDGNPVTPTNGSKFALAMGQRLDLRLDIPAQGGAFPIFAQREGARERTGIILATPGASVVKLPATADNAAGLVDLSLESRLSAANPLAPRPPDRRLTMVLSQVMGQYVWTLDGQVYGQDTPISVRQGERVEITFQNMSMMMHPMHLHGHHFQVTAIGGQPLAGAMRDTIIVPAGMGSVTVAFDADNPGQWPLHCHNLYHMAAGMMTTVRYV